MADRGEILIIPRQVFAEYPGAPQMARTRRFCFNCGGPLPIVNTDSRSIGPNCSHVDYHNPLPGIVALIIEEDHVLLGRRGPSSFQPGLWCLPGGFIEYQEDFLSAICREVREETGLEIQVNSILSVISNQLAPGLHTLVVTVLASRMKGEPYTGNDIVELGWFSLGEPLPEMAFAADAHIIERYAATRLSGAPVDPRFA